MIVPETTLAGFAEIVPKFLHTQNIAGFLLDCVGPFFPNDFEDIPDSSYDVVVMVGVINNNAVSNRLESDSLQVQMLRAFPFRPEAWPVHTADWHRIHLRIELESGHSQS